MTTHSTGFIFGHHDARLSSDGEKDVMYQVLNNPSLLDKILERAIVSADNKMDRRSACILRQVDSSWNWSVLRIFWQRREHLYQLRYGIGDYGDWLDASLKTFATSTEINGIVPPVKLPLMFFDIRDPTNFRMFSNRLTICGPALIAIEILVRGNGPHKFEETAFPQWSLPRLHKLEMMFETNVLEQSPLESTSAVQITKSILIGAIALGELCINLFSNHPYILPGSNPVIFDCVPSLPATITKLSFFGVGQWSQSLLKMLERSVLPDLESLTLSAQTATFENELLFRVLDKRGKMLKNLCISVRPRDGRQRQTGDTVRTLFPVLEILETLSIVSLNADLIPKSHSLQKYFPKLRSFEFRHLRGDVFEKWTACSQFSLVTSLELIMADDRIVEPQGQDSLDNLSLEVMQRVKFAFPKLRKLTVGVTNGRDATGLRYIFAELSQLVDLTIQVFGDMYAQTSTDVWDAILIGLTMETLKAGMAEGDTFWERFTHGMPELPSITQMKDLSRFTLVDKRCFNVCTGDYRLPLTPQQLLEPLISDLAFHHAFLKMPKLRCLNLTGQFQASGEMADKWREEEGRTIV